MLARQARTEGERHDERCHPVHDGKQPVPPRGIHPAKEETLREVDGAVHQAGDEHAPSRVHEHQPMITE